MVWRIPEVANDMRVQTMELVQTLPRVGGLLCDEPCAGMPVNVPCICAFEKLGQAVEQGEQAVEGAELLNVNMSDGEMRLEVLERLGLHGAWRGIRRDWMRRDVQVWMSS